MNSMRSLCVALAALFVLSCFLPTVAQESDDPKNEPVSLAGLAEATLINGQPALRVTSRKNGTSDIKFQKYEGEDSLLFSVFKYGLTSGYGSLYVTKTRVVFDPDKSKKRFMSIPRADIIKTESNSSWAGGMGAWRRTEIKTKDDKWLFMIVFSGDGSNNGNKTYAAAINLFLVRAISDYDKAIAEFNELTASVRPDVVELDEPLDPNPSIGQRYDRFNDMTTILTSKMQIDGGRRPIRVFASYSFAGKAQKKPEKVSLYFYASAPSAFFREDSMTLAFLVDGEVLRLGELKMSDEERTRSLIKQTVLMEMPYETFARIANGKTVEFQIGKDEFKMTGTHLGLFKKLLEYKAE